MTHLPVVIILVVLSAVFSGTETSFTSLSIIQKNELKKKKGKRAEVAYKLANSPDTLLTTILIGNNIVNISASSLTTSMVISAFGNQAVGIATGILTLVILIFGEITPKQIAINHNMGIALAMAIPVWILTIIFFPVVFVFRMISNFVTRLFCRNKNDGMSVEGIMSVIDAAEDEGVVEKNESDMVERVFDFSNTHILSIMTPKVDVFMLDGDKTIEDSYEEIVLSGFSRIPIYGESKDEIIGVLILRDMLKAIARGERSRKLSEIASAPTFVPEILHVDDLFSLFKKNKIQMAMVLDEYGELSGVVTMEDVVEELFGDIYDEHEVIEPDAIIRKEGEDGTYLVQADVSFKDFEDYFDLDVDKQGLLTSVAAYVSQFIESILSPGDSVETPIGLFKVTEMEGLRVMQFEFHPSLLAEE